MSIVEMEVGERYTGLWLGPYGNQVQEEIRCFAHSTKSSMVDGQAAGGC